MIEVRQGNEELVRRLSKSERRLLDYVARHEGVSISKGRLAETVGCDIKTIDRSMRRLREDGLVASETAWNERGAQLANVYRLGPNAVVE